MINNVGCQCRRDLFVQVLGWVGVGDTDSVSGDVDWIGIGIGIEAGRVVSADVHRENVLDPGCSVVNEEAWSYWEHTQNFGTTLLAYFDD